MSTSTSNRKKRKSKLYDYLPGYEQCCFTGEAKSDVVRSIDELLSFEIELLNGTSKTTSASKIQPRIIRFVDSFLTKYYGRMRNCTKSAKCADLAERAKKDSKVLSSLLSSIMTGATREIGSIVICPVKSQEVSDIAVNICDKCPYYLNHKFCILYDYTDTDEIDYNFISFSLPEYKYLALAMVTLSSYLVKEDGISVNHLIAYHMLFEYIITVGKIYELMNPSDEVRQGYLDEAEKLLTSDPLDVNTEIYQYYDGVLDSVFQDIKEGKLRYIQDMKIALEKAGPLIHSKYDPKLDIYASMKGTAQRKYTGQKRSLLSSCFEVDVYKDKYKEFDDYVGFISTYPEKNPEYQDDICTTRTILINNPGKFKPRIIHIGDNPTQDRCMFIHRRLKGLLHYLPEDSTEDQEKGREFLQTLTLDWFVEQNPAKRCGIYCFDFSNATDTLDQHFQHRVLEFVFGPEVANFWDKVSESSKHIQVAKGGYRCYQQTCGQPQGLLGSFDAFALAHHFIFLMDMKLLGLENHSAKNFYRILGDDSVSTSIEPEIDTFTRGQIVDVEGISRSITEKIHFDICQNFAGFKVNFDKSESTHWDSDEAKLDFAKVTYRNGQLFTPIPFRLAMSFHSSDDAKLAVAIWRGERKDPGCRFYMDLLLRSMDPIKADIIKSGVLPFLDTFKDDSINFNESWLARLRYASAVSHLSMALSFSVVDDRERDRSRFDIVERSLKRLLTARVAAKLDKINPNHKVMRLWEENADIMQVMHNIYEYDELDDRFLVLACSTLGEEFLKGDFFDCLHTLGTTRKALLLAKSNPELDVSLIFPDFNTGMERRLSQFSQKFMTRGIAKRPREEVSLFKAIIDTLKEVDDVLGACQRHW